MPRPSLEWDMANTIVEDSEPEREAEERRLKEERRQRKHLAKQFKKEKEVAIVPSISLKQCSPPSIIEIIDPSESISPSKSSTRMPMVALSDSSSEEIQRTLASSPTNSVEDAVIDLLVRPINLENHISPSKEGTKPSLDLTRFAFPRTNSQKTFTAQRVQNLPMPVRLNIASSKSSQSPTLPAFAIEFTNQQLNSLLKCVVCDLTWTVRKTVPMKMAHVRACARKNGWADTTVKVRLALLLEQILPCTTTLLEEVVNKSTPKKTRKKNKEEAFTTVMDPHDAHQIIIQRAKTLFAQASLDRIREAEDAPATQTFPPTRLGVPGSGFLGSAMEEEHEAPIVGQVSLGTTFPVSEAVGGYLPSAGHANLVIPLNSPLRPPSPPFTTLRKSFDVPTVFRSIKEGAYSPTNLNKLEDIDRRLAAIHFGSLDNHRKHTTPAGLRDSITKKKKNSKGKERGRPEVVAGIPLKAKTRNRSSSRSRSRSPIGNSTKSSKSPRRPKNQTNRYFDVATEETLRQIIMSNTSLYHKILHYEPIHFEQLIQMPALKELNGVGFKFKLIKFLDKHAINFYGDSSLATGRRSRYK